MFWGWYLLGIVVVVAGAKLWRMGGDGHDWARSIAFPAMIGISKAMMLGNWLAIIYWFWLWLMIAGFSYGESAPPRLFWAWILNRPVEDEDVEVLTRATCGFFWSLAGLWFAWITGNWIAAGIYTIFLTIANTYFGRMSDVEKSERGVGASVACSIWII